MQSTEKKAIYNQDITQKRGTVENKRLEKNNRMNWDWHEILELLLYFQKVHKARLKLFFGNVGWKS